MNRHPKTTMSVLEMGKLLGLKKVHSYWLVHKGYFETILLDGKIRVVIKSFEHWYAGQVKYRKVTGEPPGERLKQESYSARDIAEILQINEQYAYKVMQDAGIEPVIVDYWKRFPRDAFDAWYAGQTRFRNAEDRLRDAEIEENSMSMPDMARLLDVSKNVVYGILNSSLGKELLEVIIIADRKRITRESFERWYERWYSSQRQYLKPEDQPPGVPRKRKSYAATLVKKKVKAGSKTREIRYSSNPDYLTVDEAAFMAKVNTDCIYRWIKTGKIPALRVSRMVTRIPRADYEMFLRKYMKQNKEKNDGINC